MDIATANTHFSRHETPDGKSAFGVTIGLTQEDHYPLLMDEFDLVMDEHHQGSLTAGGEIVR